MENGLNELSKYRYECAEEALEDARIMFENNRFKNALNRAYYAIFYALRSVNALDGFDSSKHSGVIAHFNQKYVKTGTLRFQRVFKILTATFQLSMHASEAKTKNLNDIYTFYSFRHATK